MLSSYSALVRPVLSVTNAGLRAEKKDYFQNQIGNPGGADKPNKKVCLMMGLAICPEIDVMCSTMIHMSGCMKVKRP
jgi:hypothetical protein